MTLELRSPRATALAHELAAATGEDIETAVERALQDRLSRLAPPPVSDKIAEIDAIFERLARMPVLDCRLADEIIGYDDRGLPR